MSAYWSWLLTVVGVTGLYLAGRKVWWAWFVGLGAQVLWLAYALATHQYGFLVSAFAYGWVYAKNGRAWMREHRSVYPDGSDSGEMMLDAQSREGDARAAIHRVRALTDPLGVHVQAFCICPHVDTLRECDQHVREIQAVILRALEGDES